MLSQIQATGFESASPQMFDTAESGCGAPVRHPREASSYFELLSRPSARRAPPRSAIRPLRFDSSR